MLVSLVLTATAQATVTTSSITSPSDPYFVFDQGQSGQNVTVSGTSNGTSGDSVDIDCYIDDGSTGSYDHTVTTLSVNSNGSFSASVPLSQFDNNQADNYTPCRLRAVQSGTHPTTGLSSYSGPRVAVGLVERSSQAPEGLYNYYVYGPQFSAADDYVSYGACGLYDSYLFDPSVFGQYDAYGFYCNDFPEYQTQSDPSRTGVLVDGHPAYPPNIAHHINNNAVGFQPLTIDSITQNSSNGDLTIVETDPLMRCVGDAYPANNKNCLAFVSAGVQLKRTITQTDDGHIVYFRDAYSSTDGAAHSVNLLLENDQYFHFNQSSQDIQYEFPGQTSFSAYSKGQTVSVPSKAPASILIQNAGTADGATDGGRGAITYAQPPSGSFAFGLNDPGCCSDFDAPNTVSVPTSGSANVAYAYSTEFTLAAAQHDALVAQDAFQPPALKVTRPRNHSKVKKAKIRVTGTASAGSGVKSVTVNRKAVKVSGGKFSTTVRLHVGRNTLKVKLTSNAGNTVTKRVTVRYVKAAMKTKKKTKPAPPFTG